LSAAQCARRARRIRILIGIEGIATAAALRLSRRRLLHDRRRRRNLLIIGRLLLHLGLPGDRIGLRRDCRDVGLTADGGLTAGRRTQLPQAIFELPVAILQLLILAGELPQLVLKLLDADFRIDVVRLLSERLRSGREHRDHHGRACKH
jgi:hypothetical protein